MTTRRDLIAGVAALPLAACGGGASNAAVAQARAPLSGNPEIAQLVRYATLAPSGHNTQPWRWAVRPTGASISPDTTRRTPVVDPDDHHLYVSLGCAAETFLIAAAAHGRPGTLAVTDGKLDLDLAQGPARSDELYRAIPLRQSTRSIYSGRAVSSADLKRLAAAARGNGVDLSFVTGTPRREALLEQLIAGNSRQMDDPAFIAELLHWLRFNEASASATGDGLFSASSGNPTLPTWLGRRMFGLVFDKASENEKYAAQVRSSAGIVVFTGARADPASWIDVGRSYQRFALQATALGIRHAMLNQLVEVPSVRAGFAHWLGIGDARPDLVVRFGYAAQLPMSFRRPVADVIVA